MAESPRKKSEPIRRIIPIVEERLRVRKARDEKLVRVKKTAAEHETTIDVPLDADEVVIERVPVGRFVEGPIPVRQEGDTVVISVLEEVPVVRLRLKEEIRITKKRVTRRETRSARLRSESVAVERDAARIKRRTA